MSQSLSVCPRCRDICAKCHTQAKPETSHGIWACHDCAKEIGTKCCICNGAKKGPGTLGATGAGKVCKSCYKMNKCTFCGTKI